MFYFNQESRYSEEHFLESAEQQPAKEQASEESADSSEESSEELSEEQVPTTSTAKPGVSYSCIIEINDGSK